MPTTEATDAVGLTIDMLDVDRLREWARLLLVHGADIGHWGSVPHVAGKMQTIATCIEKAVRDIGTLRDERARLRAALVGIVGVDGREELEQLEAAMRLMPAPAADKAATIDAIHALLATAQPQALAAVDPVDGKGQAGSTRGGSSSSSESSSSGARLGPAWPPDGWHSMESAPKDGTWILGFGEGWGLPDRMVWSRMSNCWVFMEGEASAPTHWMPLPAPPAGTGTLR